jgi:hypothetical protein
MKPFHFVLALLFVSKMLMAQGWKREDKTDALRGTHYLEFELDGTFLTPPKRPGVNTPMMVVDCLPGQHLKVYGGRFIAGFVVTGAVLSSQVIEKDTVLGGRSLPTVIPVEFRLDDGKVQEHVFNPSTDGTSAFFPETILSTLLYGHYLPHKEGKGDPIKKVVLAMDEYLAGRIVIQFDMPDPHDVADSCGVIAHKRGQ